MRSSRLTRARTMLVAAALSLPAVPAAAQYSVPGAQDPSTVLADSLRTLSTSPRDINAMMAAGRASLEMGDVQAAAGFFGRAEEAYPNSPVPKIGKGAALAMTGDPTGALTFFQRAAALGAPASMYALDRGLAFDLLGRQSEAQADYRLAMGGPQADEARRRLALSLAISRDIKGAAATIEPLLARRDQAAYRINAFVLALAGDREGARRTIDAAMPGAGSRFEPFFKLLPVLRANEKAAAVHLGEFPKDAAQRYAAAEPVSTSPVVSIGGSAPIPTASAPPRATVKTTPPPGRTQPVRVAEAPRRAEREAQVPNTYMAMVRPSLDPSRYASSRRKPAPAATPSATPKTEAKDPDPRPAFSVTAVDELAPIATEPEPIQPLPGPSSLNSAGEPIQTVSVAEAEPAPPPSPSFEAAPPPSRPKVERIASTRSASAARKPPAKPEAKPEPKPEPIGATGTYWVQLAGGTNADRMGVEYRRIRGKQPALFAGRTAYVTNGKDYFRLLLGPFKSPAEAHALVTKLDKAGIDSFMWTRTPPRIKIEKLASK